MALDTNDLRAAFSIVSAIAMLLLGIATLAPRQARARGALAFGLFASVWALQFLTANIYSVLLTDHVIILQLASLALWVPLPYFLLEFATGLAPASSRRLWALARLGAAALAMTNALMMLSLPQLYFGSLGQGGNVAGPLLTPLVHVPFFLSFALALVALYNAYAGAPTIRSRLRVAPLLLGLGLYASFQSAFYVSYYGVGLFLYPIVLRDLVLIVTFLVLALTVAVIIRRLRSTLVADAMRLERAVPIALGAALAYGLLEGAFASAFANSFSTLGLWRLAGVAVIAYGLARWRVFDLPQRTRATASNVGATTLAAAGGAAAYGAGTLVAAAPIVPLALGLAVGGAALIPSFRFMRHLVARPQEPAKESMQLYGQRIDTYRAALESSLARGTLEEDETFLEGLRERFHISEDEHRVLLYYAQSSVIVARDTDAWGAYEKIRLLGEGGGGRTWLARDRARERLVVLKEPLEHWQRDPRVREAVLREARMALKVRHPNVVRVEEVVEGQHSPIIVMEYCEGGSLSDLLRARGTLAWREACEVVAHVARGLEAVHAAGVVHRDVKPSNILLDGEGAPKIGDFGIAKAPEAGSGKTMVDVADGGPVMGSPAYMAPEARLGRGDRRVDIYGLAAVLHECVYGAPPSPQAPVVVRDDVPEGLAALLARGLAERPDDRPPSARAFADELARMVKG